MKFSELKVRKEILKALDEMKFKEMMPIQEKSIPVILDGKNIIGEAATGTGKTGAFLIPMLNNIDFNSGKIESIIVTPTRELALQIASEISKTGKYLPVQYVTLVGGMSIEEQSKKLKQKPSIVIGTLGRINDHLRGRRLDLSHVKYFVLDEADEMLKEGFKEDITAIHDRLPSDRQTLLFSATYTKTILKLSEDIMDSYEMISVKSEKQTSSNIEQSYIIMKEKNKFSALTKLLDIDKPELAIIFGRTKRRADELNDALNKCGYKSTCIHGDLNQSQRNTVMKKFRNHEINILVATDVAARGLDIDGITHVYNFDLPQEVEFYIHRIGRTGRANKTGISYSFIKESELPHIRKIEKETGVTITNKELPNNEELMLARKKDLIDKIEHRMQKLDINKNKELAETLLDEFGELEIASILVDVLGNKKVQDISLTGEPGVRVKADKSAKSEKSGNRGRRNYVADRNIKKRVRKRDSKRSGNKIHKKSGNRNN